MRQFAKEVLSTFKIWHEGLPPFLVLYWFRWTMIIINLSTISELVLIFVLSDTYFLNSLLYIFILFINKISACYLLQEKSPFQRLEKFNLAT